MEITFSNSTMRKMCNDYKKAVSKLGAKQAGILFQRLDEIRDAPNLVILKQLPGPRLTQNRRGTFAVNLVHPRRLIFEPDQEPPPLLEDGGIDWGAVHTVNILDYH
jgi:toxin HigB-1